MRILDEWGGSGLAVASSSWIGSEAPSWSGFVGVSVVPSLGECTVEWLTFSVTLLISGSTLYCKMKLT